MDIEININLDHDFGGGIDGPATPSDLANLVRWYKADGVLYTDAAGTDLVDTNLDPIGFVTDESGTGNDATQDTTAEKSTWLSAGPAMNFDGGDKLVMPDPYTTAAAPSTVCYVMDNTVGDKFFNGYAVGEGLTAYLQISNNFIRTNWGGPAGSFGNSPLQAGKNIIFIQFDFAALRVRLFLFTVAGGLNTDPVPRVINVWPTNGYTHMTFGMFDYNESMYEMFQTTDLLSDADMIAQGEALADKWGVS